MAIQLQNIKSIKSKTSAKRLGRGLGSGKGRYSGKGQKGQKARAGGRGGLKRLGMKGNIQSLPKLPGFNSLKAKLAVVNLDQLEKAYKEGEKVNAVSLKAKGLITNSKVGVKVLGNGKITKKLLVIVDKLSSTAKEAIEGAGGTIKMIEKPVVKKLSWEDRQSKQQAKEQKPKAKKEVKPKK